MEGAGILGRFDTRSIRMPTALIEKKWPRKMVRFGVRMVRDKREGRLAGRRMSERTTLRHQRK